MHQRQQRIAAGKPYGRFRQGAKRQAVYNDLAAGG